MTIYVSNKGSSVLLTGLVRRLRQRNPLQFRLIFLTVGPNCDRRGRRRVLSGTTLVSVPLAIFRSTVFSIIRGISSSPYCLYTHVHENGLCRGTRRVNYGGVTLNRRFSSIVRAVLVGVFCNKAVRAVVPGLRDQGFRKVRLVQPLCRIGRTSVVT